MQGAGNDFVLAESDDNRKDWSGLSQAICDRHYGIGADGLLVMSPSGTADVSMRIFNADGSESDVCGNGLRCLVSYYADTRPAGTLPGTVKVETRAGIREAVIRYENSRITDIKTGMGQPGLEETAIPVRPGRCSVDINGLFSCKVTAGGGEVTLYPVSMGNPHAVCFIGTQVAGFPLEQTGRDVAAYELFPEGANFEIARVTDRTQIDARVLERGVGETLACGSGACAIAVAARLKGYCDDTVDIRLPGGVLTVEWNGAGEVFLSGPAETVFTGEWNR